MEQLLAIAEKIETPLSLAALAVLVLYGLFKIILEGLDLKSILKVHTYRVLMRAMTYVFVLAIVALVLGLLSYLATSFLADWVRVRRTDDLLRQLSDASPTSRIVAINGLSEIASRDRRDHGICDGLASLVRRGAETTLRIPLREIDGDVAASMKTISELTRSGVCSQSDLQGSDLRRLELPKAALMAAKLTGARLDDANLDGADLTGVDLTGANLSSAVLRGSSLRNAKLNEVNFSGTTLDSVDMTSAEGLRGARLFSASMEEAKLDHTDLRGAQLPMKGMKGASLRGANLTGLDLSKLQSVCRTAFANAITDAARLPEHDC